MDVTTSIGGSDLLKRIAIFNNTRNNQGTMAVDKETEDLTNVSVALGTLDAFQAQAQEHMAAISRIPIVKLLGIQPAGLNASSEGEIKSFYDWIHAFQESLFRDPLTKVIDFIQLSEIGDVDNDITFDFKSLYQLDESEKVDIEGRKAQIHEGYLGSNVVSPEEVRKAVAKDPDSLYGGLDLDKTPPPAAPGMGEMGGAPMPGEPPMPGLAELGGGGPAPSVGNQPPKGGNGSVAPVNVKVGDNRGAVDHTVHVFHGTRSAALQSIADNGLLAHPSKHYHPNRFYQGDRGDSVYVSPDPKAAASWALSATDNASDATLLELEVPAENLLPDENAVGAERFVGNIPPQWIKAYYPIMPNGQLGSGHPFVAHNDATDSKRVRRYAAVVHRAATTDAKPKRSWRLSLAKDAGFVEAEHPRGQPITPVNSLRVVDLRQLAPAPSKAI
jgi:hypothetical protein